MSDFTLKIILRFIFTSSMSCVFFLMIRSQTRFYFEVDIHFLSLIRFFPCSGIRLNDKKVKRFFSLHVFRSSCERLATAGQLPVHSGLHHHVPPDRLVGAKVHEEQAAFLLQGNLSCV